MNLLSKIADAAKARFPEIPFPHKKDEYWRFSNVKEWDVHAMFDFFQGIAKREKPNEKFDIIEKSLNEKNSLVVFDGQLLFADLPQGVRVCSMSAAAEDYPHNVEEFYKSATGKFDTLQASRPAMGVYIKVDEGAEATLNLGIVSKLGLSTVGVIVDLGRGAKLNLSRQYLTFGGSFCAAHTGYFLAENSFFELATAKFGEENSRQYEREDFNISAGAKIYDAYAQVGLSPTRQERNFNIASANAEIDSRIFAKMVSSITHDIRTSQNHIAGCSKSNVSIKAAIFDRARLAFSGLIRVDEAAQKTDSYQSCRSLLLSDNACAQASPILEICANDVSCSHGCVVSKLDSEVLFYMRQRGLTLNQSLEMMVQSFAESTFENVKYKNFTL